MVGEKGMGERYEVRSTKYEARSTKYEVRSTKAVVVVLRTSYFLLLHLSPPLLRPVRREPERHLLRQQPAVPQLGELLAADALPREQAREHEVEHRRLGEEAAGGHAEDRDVEVAREPEETAGVRGDAVALYRGAQPGQRAERRV